MQRHDRLPPDRNRRLCVQDGVQLPRLVFGWTEEDGRLVLQLHAVLRSRRYGGQEAHGEPPGGPGGLRLVLDRALTRQPRFRPVSGGVTGRARPGHSPRARAGCGRGTGRVVPRAGEVRVLRGLPGHQPRRRPSLGVEQSQRNPAVVVVPPRVRPGGAEVLAGRHRRRPLVLLLLDLGYLVGVLVGTWPVPHRFPHAQQPARLTEDPLARSPLPVLPSLLGRPLLIPQQFRVAGARGGVVVLVFTRRPVGQTVGVGRRLPVAEIRTVPATTYPPCHPALFDRLTYHHTILLELFGQDRVQERVAARVEREDEHGEDLRLLQRHQLEPEGRREREERDG